MGTSKTIGTYTDIARILDTALEAGGATFRLDSPGKAVHFIQRAYAYRKLLHDMQARQLATIHDTRSTHTAYDTMKLTREEHIVVITFDVIEGVLLDGEGNPLELPDPIVLAPRPDEIDLDDEMRDTIDEAQRMLGLDVEP